MKKKKKIKSSVEENSRGVILNKKDFIILHGKVAAFILSKEGQKLIKEGDKEIINLSNRIFKKETLDCNPLTKKILILKGKNYE